MKKQIVIAAAILMAAIFSGCSGENHVKQSETTEEERESGRDNQKDDMDDEKSFLPEAPDKETSGYGKEATTQEGTGDKDEDVEYSESQPGNSAETLEDIGMKIETGSGYSGFDYGAEGGKTSGGEWTQTDEGSMFLMEDGSYARNAWIGQDYVDCRGVLLLNAMEKICEKEADGSAGKLIISPSWEYTGNEILDPEEWVGKYLDDGRSITVIASDESGITYESISYGEEGWYTVSYSASWLDGSHCIAYRHYYNSSGGYLGDEFLTWHGDTILIHGNEFSDGTYIKEDNGEIYEPVCGIYTESNLNRYDKNGDKEVAYAYYNEENGNLQITYAVEHIVPDTDGYTTYITWQGGYEGPLSEDNRYAIGSNGYVSPDKYEFTFTTPKCIEVYKNGDYLETLYGYSLYTVY